MSLREYPAYGRTIASHVVRGQKPICVAVLLSARWGYFNHVPKVCIKPDEWALGRYEFGFLGGMHVVVVPGDESNEAQLAELLIELMRVGPQMLWAFDADGTKLYDGDGYELDTWVRDLLHHAGIDWRSRWPQVKTAYRVMMSAQARAIDRFTVEAQRIQEKSGVEAFVRWATWHEFEVKDRVRELFSTSPPGDARAA